MRFVTFLLFFFIFRNLKRTKLSNISSIRDHYQNENFILKVSCDYFYAINWAIFLWKMHHNLFIIYSFIIY